MIRDLDASMAAWLSDLVPYAATEVQAVPDNPTDSSRPTLALILVDVQEDPAAGVHGLTTLRSEEGVVVGRAPAQRRYRFTYLVTAFAEDPLEAHAALGSVLAGAALSDVVPEGCLRGTMTECPGAVLVRCAPEHRDEPGRDRWPLWRVAGRLALELDVLAPLPAAAVAEVAEPPSRIELRSSGGYVPSSPNGSPALARPRPTARITEG